MQNCADLDGSGLVVLLLAYTPQSRSASSRNEKELALALVGDDNSIQITALGLRQVSGLP